MRDTENIIPYKREKKRNRVEFNIEDGILIEIGYQASERQTAFHQSIARYRFYGGAAGGGKTEALLQEAIAQIIEAEGKGVQLNGIILRRSFPELERTVIRRFLEQVPKEYAVYNGSRHIAQFRGGSTLEFGYCKDEGDVRNYLSAEYDFIAIDELTQFTEYMFKMLVTRLRTTKKGVFANFFGASNPGGVGHQWVKRLFVNKSFSREENFRVTDFDFIPAKVYDNPFLCNIDPEYVRRLENLPEKLRAIYLDGSWDVFEGQFFTEWRPEVHVKEFDVDESWEKWICGDYGYRAPSAVYWLAKDGDSNVYVYRELYQAGLTAKELASKILDLTKEQISKVVFDPACWGRMQGLSIAEVFAENGLYAIRGNNNRVAGANLVREYLKVEKDAFGKESARLRIHPTCSELIRSVPCLVHSENNSEDVDTYGEDHAYDAIRYGLMQTSYQEPEEEDYGNLEARIDPNTGYVMQEVYSG